MTETVDTDPAGAGFVYNPFAPGFADDPYPHYAQLRVADPVHQHPLGFWMIGRYGDVTNLLRSKNSVEDRNAAASSLTEMYEVTVAEGMRRALGMSMLDRDPPDHTRLRKLVAKAFTVRSVAALEPRVVELVDTELDRIAKAGGADLIDALAYPLPFTVICDLLGMLETDHARLRELAGVLVGSLEPVIDPARIAEIERAEDEISHRIAEVIAAKRRQPADDLLTALINAEEDGDNLSDEELVAQVVLLYVAGHETTVNLVANGTLALLRNPKQAMLLRERPDLDVNAIEELLRYDSPVQMSRRITLAPYPVGGKEIPTGSFVLAGLASANRDELFWGVDAGELRVDRPSAKAHLSFGGGPHHCLGAALARLEGRVAISRLIRRFPTLTLDGEVAWNGRLNLRGPSALPVTVR
ncbi:MAG: cytochrome P450 [Pseudonocardia sp.]|nr:cytochrome P450 [Pseudonocardia sp.]